ncbi:MAG: NAD(P)H-dependent oxidoreductase [Armatimonadetes bacterium]|nr:NAD(P)H-dependent oxidoreductase [Armatimonadota bacterium]
MKVLIVHAHPEATSFNSALTRHAVEVLSAAGHEVQVSDLYAMGWNPVSGRENFRTVVNGDRLDLQDEEIFASRNDGFAEDIRQEWDKLEWCDVLIFQFPLWWFSLPAILKGWVDRVFACGHAYGGGKWYSRGVFRGKRAMLSLTTGGHEPMFSENGLNGSIEQILYPIHHGILYFVGFDVLPPFVAWGPSRVGDEAREAYFREYGERLTSLDQTEPIAYLPLEAYDERFVRKS